jgi:hypothetical protein
MAIKSDLFKCLLLAFIGTSISYSCNNENVKEENKEPLSDSLQAAISIAAEDSALMFDNKTSEWITKSLKKVDWNWKRFHLIEFWFEDTLSQQPLQEGAVFYKKYAPLLRWSADSNYVLDIGSYGAAAVKDDSGKTHLENGDIDTEVSLLYPKAKKKSRLLFFGSRTSVIDARWIDSSQAALFGMHEKTPDLRSDTLLWIINAKDKYFRKYKWQ